MLLPELFPGLAFDIVCNTEVSEIQQCRFHMRWMRAEPCQYRNTRVQGTSGLTQERV